MSKKVEERIILVEKRKKIDRYNVKIYFVCEVQTLSGLSCWIDNLSEDVLNECSGKWSKYCWSASYSFDLITNMSYLMLVPTTA